MEALTKLIGLAMLSILLVGFGAALAMWSETLGINTYVNTGEVKVEWSEWSCSDVGPDPQADGFSNDEGKDVAQCLISVEEDDEGNPIKMNVTIVNGYPGYAVNVTLIVDNIGTLPVKLYEHVYTNLDPEDQEALDIRLIVPEDTQIEPGDAGTYILEIIIKQDANETATYSFDLELTFAQWNEVD